MSEIVEDAFSHNVDDPSEIPRSGSRCGDPGADYFWNLIRFPCPRVDGSACTWMVLTAPAPGDWGAAGAPSHHMVEHRPARSENSQLHIEWSGRPGSEPSSVEAHVYIWRYALL